MKNHNILRSPLLQAYESQARQIANISGATLVKFSTESPKISYLTYADFDHNPHPPLLSSTIVNLETGSASQRDYRQVDNPPILHRKETFLSPNDPRYSDFAHLTQQEVELGLLKESRLIGTRRQWEQRLATMAGKFSKLIRLVCFSGGITASVKTHI